jgi:hypothetical protein
MVISEFAIILGQAPEVTALDPIAPDRHSRVRIPNVVVRDDI